MFVLGAHYFIGIIVLFYFWGKTKGFATKAILVAAWFLPLPLLTIGLFLAIVLSTKLGQEFIDLAEKVAINDLEALPLAAAVVAAPETGGASLVAAGALEGGTVAAEGAVIATEGAAVATEGAVAAGEAAAAATEGVTTTTTELGTEGVGAGADLGENAASVFSNPLDNPVGEAGKELDIPSEEQFHEGEGFENETQEEPEGERDEMDHNTRRIVKGVERAQKVVDIIDNVRQPQGNDEDEDEQAEDLADAA
jgi:hypothetical protein